MDSSTHQELYERLSLPVTPPFLKCHITTKEKELKLQWLELMDEIDCTDIQERLKNAMDNIVITWTHKHDQLIDRINVMEATKRELKNKLKRQQQQCDISVRETQIYKTRYESLVQQNKSSSSQKYNQTADPTTVDVHCISEKSLDTATFSEKLLFIEKDDIIDPAILFYKEEALSIKTESNSAILPNSPDTTPTASPLTSDFVDKESVVTTDTNNESLKYGCGPGFWSLIANGKGNKEEVDALISNYIRRGGNANVAKNSETVKNVKEGYGLIHAIIAIRNTSALQQILNVGVNIYVCPLTTKKEDQVTPLILAAKLGYMSGVRLLTERGGLPSLLESKGPYGENLLHCAVQSGSENVVDFFMKHSKGALLEQMDNNGATPLHYACITGKTQFITLFIRNWQARSDPRDNKGETPLHYAIRNQKLKVIHRLVVDLGVYPNSYIPKQVPTPLDLAKQGGLKAIADFLKSVGAKTTKQMERTSRSVHSNNSSTFGGESSASGDSTVAPSTITSTGVRHYLQTKTSQILRGTFDI